MLSREARDSIQRTITSLQILLWAEREGEQFLPEDAAKRIENEIGKRQITVPSVAGINLGDSARLWRVSNERPEFQRFVVMLPPGHPCPNCGGTGSVP